MTGALQMHTWYAGSWGTNPLWKHHAVLTLARQPRQCQSGWTMWRALVARRRSACVRSVGGVWRRVIRMRRMRVQSAPASLHRCRLHLHHLRHHVHRHHPHLLHLPGRPHTRQSPSQPQCAMPVAHRRSRPSTSSLMRGAQWTMCMAPTTHRTRATTTAHSPCTATPASRLLNGTISRDRLALACPLRRQAGGAVAQTGLAG